MESFPFWSDSTNEVVGKLGSSENGLSQSTAQEILGRVGPNTIQSKERVTPFGLFLNQFKSLIVLILIFATVISAFLKDWADAVIILLIVLGSALLSFFQEYNANNAAEKLRDQVSLKSDMLRNGKPALIPTEEIVPGDAVLLSAGSLIPADGLVLEAKDFFVNQAVLTGETFRDMVSGMLDIYLFSVSNRMNEVMKVLTIIATIFIPLTFIAGIYGMNFVNMPELQWPWGYFIVWGVMIVIVIAMIIYFKRKNGCNGETFRRTK